jgi:hypothetical protein
VNENFLGEWSPAFFATIIQEQFLLLPLTDLPPEEALQPSLSLLRL